MCIVAVLNLLYVICIRKYSAHYLYDIFTCESESAYALQLTAKIIKEFVTHNHIAKMSM